MIIVSGVNLQEVIAGINFTLRVNGMDKSVSSRIELPCCAKAKVVFIGGLTISEPGRDDGRTKNLLACRNCGQLHKEEGGKIVQVYGTIPEYFANFIAKHTKFGITLGTKAQEMGVPLACK